MVDGVISLCMAVSAKARKHIEGAGLSERLACMEEEGSVCDQASCHSAALLKGRRKQQDFGYAITAKPSANLYILLQVDSSSLLRHMHQ
jgi:hypothetical protein